MKIFNTMTRSKEEFKPLEEGKVKMYVCGPTVYNYIHVGNARPFIIFDTLRRYLEYRGYDVTFVQNFTDVDDKIIKRGHEEGIAPEEIAQKYNKSPAQILLRWNIQQNIIPIPKSKNPARLEENFFVFDFTLEDKDMQILNSMNENHRTSYNPLTFDF